MPTASRWSRCPRLQIVDAAARARRDHRSVSRRRPQGAGRGGLTFYMFGADEAENAAAVANVRKMYPDLQIVGHSHGYLRATRCAPRSTRSTRWRRTICGWRSAFPTSRPLSRHSRRGFPMSASSRPRADCSTSCPAAGPARRDWMQTTGTRMGLAHLAGAAPAVLALSHHQSARALSCCSTRAGRRGS